MELSLRFSGWMVAWICIFFFPVAAFAQWDTLNIPNGGRYDDVFFIDPNTGWAAGGNSQEIYKTIDGGETWEFQWKAPAYLRSIEFLNKRVGFCGALDTCFYQTSDGGKTWQDIAGNMPHKVRGICGLSAPQGSGVIYGCGAWYGPAFVIKSEDVGASWTITDMSQYASALVDIHFTSSDTGFVTGKGLAPDKHGVVLYTTDGGKHWEFRDSTSGNNEFIWKIQSPDGVHYFGSVQSSPAIPEARIIKSSDKGQTWAELTVVQGQYHYLQAIGFLDANHGFTGGDNVLFETVDGGLHWTQFQMGLAYNRFFRVNEQLAFVSGDKIYRYSTQPPLGLKKSTLDQRNISHHLEAGPNPALSVLDIKVDLKGSTHCVLQLLDASGKVMRQVCDEKLSAGEHSFRIYTEELFPGEFFLVMMTNEGIISRKILVGTW